MKYSKEDIVPVRAKLRFSTLIVLPEDEEILDFTTGDKEFWIINGAHNLCYVHPAQAGIRSNLNLITASGHVYSFLLTEISNEPNAEPDLKIFVEPKEGLGCRGEHRAARLCQRRGGRGVQERTRNASRADGGSNPRGASPVRRADEPFPLRATRRNSNSTTRSIRKRRGSRSSSLPSTTTTAFTYIQCAAREKPALYEIKDGKPNLISFQVENGVYIAPKIIDSGYLAIGKKKLPFARRVVRELRNNR